MTIFNQSGCVVDQLPFHFNTKQASNIQRIRRVDGKMNFLSRACRGLQVVFYVSVFWLSCWVNCSYAHDLVAEQFVEQAWKTCFSASRTRLHDVQLAKQEYEQALNYIRQAIDLDSTVIDTPSKQISRRLDFCHEVGNRFRRKQAETLLLEAFQKCDESKEALLADQFSEANSFLAEYREKRNEALQMTDSSNFLKTLFVKMKQCDQMEKEIEMAADQFNAFAQLSKQANAILRASALTCKKISLKLQNEKVDLNLTGTQSSELKRQLNGTLDNQQRLPIWIDGIRGSHPTTYQKLKKSLQNQQYCVSKLEDKIEKIKEAHRSVERKRIESSQEELLARIKSTLDLCEKDDLLIPEMDSIEGVMEMEAKWDESEALIRLKLDIDNLLLLVHREKLPPESLVTPVSGMNSCVENLREKLVQRYDAIAEQEMISLVEEAAVQNNADGEDAGSPHRFRDWRKFVQDSPVEENNDILLEELQ